MAVDKDKQFTRQNQWTRENRDRIELQVPKGTKDLWKAKAEAEGLTLTEWITKKVSQD